MSVDSWTDDELESSYGGWTIEKYAKHIARWKFNVDVDKLVKELKKKYPSGVLPSDKKRDYSSNMSDFITSTTQ